MLLAMILVDRMKLSMFMMLRCVCMCLVVFSCIRMWLAIHLMDRDFWMELSMLIVLLINCFEHGMFMEVNWLNIMLVIKSMIKRVMILVYYFMLTHLLLMANLSIMRGILVAKVSVLNKSFPCMLWMLVRSPVLRINLLMVGQVEMTLWYRFRISVSLLIISIVRIVIMVIWLLFHKKWRLKFERVVHIHLLMISFDRLWINVIFLAMLHVKKPMMSLMIAKEALMMAQRVMIRAECVKL